MTRLTNNSTSENLNEEAKLLQKVIIKTSSQSISKRRSCENSKVWWTDELTQLEENLQERNECTKRQEQKKIWWFLKEIEMITFKQYALQRKNHDQTFWTRQSKKKFFKHTNSSRIIEWNSYHRFSMKTKRTLNSKINGMHSSRQCIRFHSASKTRMMKQIFD